MVCLVIQAKDDQISLPVFSQYLCTVKVPFIGKTEFL